MFPCCFGDKIRRGAAHQRVHFPGLADIPVLTEFAGQITAGGAEGKNRRAGQEMIQRLFLDRIDGKAAGATVTGHNDLIVQVLAYEA
jgi:hypothetical protein